MENTYRKSKGNAGLEGVQFQLNLLMVFLLNAFHGRKNWKISTENQEAGKYDDLVLELPDKSILLQAKFKQNRKINKDQLFSCNSKNADFSLPKYFFSYLEVQSASVEKTVIICTNTNLDEKGLENFLTHNSVSLDSMLHYEGVTSPFLTFGDNIIADLKTCAQMYLDKNLQGKGFDETVITDENIKDFLNHLQFFTNYPSGDKLDKVIGQLLTRLSNFGLFRGVSSLELYKKIEDWFKQPKGEYLTEERAKAMFSEIKSDQFCEELKKYNVLFKRNELDFSNTKAIFVADSSEGHLMQALKIYDALQNDEGKKLFVGFYEDKEMEKEIIGSFAFSRYSFLIIIGSAITEKFEAKEVNRKLKDIVTKYKHKKIILVADSSSSLRREIETQDFVHIDGSVMFEDLSNDCQKKLVSERNIVFQGDQTSLEELLASHTSEDWAKAVNSNILEELIRKNAIKVGMLAAGLDEESSRYYVHRTFKREMYRDRDEQDKNQIKDETFLQALGTFDLDGNYSHKIDEEIFSEETICDVEEDVVLIADSAGMGKSTVLAQLTASIKKNNSYLWMIRIELADYTDILRDLIKRGEESITILKLLNSKQSTQLTNSLEKFVFSMNKKVMLLLDGIDEISPDYTKLILSCLTHCLQSSNFAKLFITTRPHMVLDLERVLKVKPFILQPFTEQNQVDFLTWYWAYNLKVDSGNRGKCEQYAKTLICRMSSWTEMYDYKDITAIPLQLRMLAEIFQEGIKWNESSNWEGCKDYLLGSTVIPKLPERMEIKTLYQMFIEKKGDIYIDKVNPSGNSAANKVLMEHFNESLITHRRFALELILRKEDCLLFSCYQQNHEDISESVLKIGIIQRSNHEFNFIHRTFAEYFVSESLVNELELQLCRPNLKFQQFLIDKIFQISEYKVIRIFLESFLHPIKYSMPLNVFDIYKSQTCYLLHPEDKYGLIHLLAREGCVTILLLILKYLKFKIIKHKEANTTDLCNHFFESKINIFQSFKRRIGIDTKTKKGNTLRVMQFFIRECGINIKNMIGRTPLQEATENGHFEMVRFLVEQGANINSVDNEGNTALHFAALIGRLDIVKFLVEHGSNVNIIDKAGCTALHFALLNDHSDVVEYLAKSDSNFNIKDNGGRTALHIAAVNGNLYTVKLLTDRRVDINIEDASGMTALHLAAGRGQLAVVEYLVQLCGDVNIKDIHGRTALHLAAANGHFDTVICLLEHGADASIKNVAGGTALSLAAASGYLNIVKYLFEKYANVYVADVRGRMPLHLAVENGHLSTAKYLMERDIDINIPDVGGKTVLHIAAANDHLEIVIFLLNYGVDPNVRDLEGNTALHLAAIYDKLKIVYYLVKLGIYENAEDLLCALHIAAANGSLETVKFLHEQGIDVNVRTSEDRTVLHSAAINGHLETVKFLLDADVEVDARDIRGDTALHLAVAHDELNIVKILLAGGADIYVEDNRGRTALHIAAENGRVATISHLILKTFIDVNIKDFGGTTSLHLAVVNYHLYVARLLLEAGGDVNVGDIEGNTALHLAVKNGYLDIVKFLIEKGADVTIGNVRGRTALHLAAASGYLAIVNHLLLETNIDVDVRDVGASTALHLAAENGHLDTVRFLLERGADVNTGDIEGNSTLHLAVANDHLDTAKFLLQRGGDINFTNIKHKTALHLAAANGLLDTVKFLLEDGADINVGDVRGRTALHYAAVEDQLTVIEYLTEIRGDPNVKDVNGCTPLHFASAHVNLKSVKFLLQRGADASLRDGAGSTALHLAAEKGCLDTVKLLLERNCDVHAEDVRGRTALHSAAEGGHLNTVKFLIEQGVDVNIRDVGSRTALHLAAAKGRSNTVKFLLKRGAYINSYEIEGNTPLHFASVNGHFDTVRLLLELGADVSIQNSDGNTARQLAFNNGDLQIANCFQDVELMCHR